MGGKIIENANQAIVVKPAVIQPVSGQKQMIFLKLSDGISNTFHKGKRVKKVMAAAN